MERARPLPHVWRLLFSIRSLALRTFMDNEVLSNQRMVLMKPLGQRCVALTAPFTADGGYSAFHSTPKKKENGANGAALLPLRGGSAVDEKLKEMLLHFAPLGGVDALEDTRNSLPAELPTGTGHGIDRT